MLPQVSDEMIQLVDALQGDIYRVQGERGLLSLAMKVNTGTVVLSRRLVRARDVEVLRELFRILDANWRTMEYRLNQTPNPSPDTLSHIGRIRQLEKKLESMFDVQTQVDLSKILRQSTEMNCLILSLFEDIRFEITDSAIVNRLLNEGCDSYKMSRRSDQLGPTDVPYSTLRQAYEALKLEWLRYERLLRPVNNRLVQR